MYVFLSCPHPLQLVTPCTADCYCLLITTTTSVESYHCSLLYTTLFHRRTRAFSVYNGCLAWYNMVLTSRVYSSVKFVGLLLVTHVTVE